MSPQVDESERVFAHRMSQFLRMGFSAAQAEELATSGSDWHDIETHLAAAKAADCPQPHRVIFRLYA